MHLFPILRRFHLTALICLLAMAGAFYVQFGLRIYPCAWCSLIRFIFVLLFFVAWAATLVDCPVYRKSVAGIGVLLSLWGIGTSLYSYFVASLSASCENSFANLVLNGLKLSKLNGLFGSFGPCHRTPFLGMDMSLWALIAFTLCLVLLGLELNRRLDPR